MIIDMPVEVVCKRCAVCPDLEIDVSIRRYAIDHEIAGYGKINISTECTNVLRCANYDICKNRFENIFKKEGTNIMVKTVKEVPEVKASAKKTVTKKAEEKKAPVKKTVVKKVEEKKTPVAKKSTVKKVPVKKTEVKKTPVKKPAAKKETK